MNLSNHSTVTPTVTFNPFLPTIGRVYQVLCDAAPAGETIETNNRKLAEAAQCSPGAIPDILRELEFLDYIERVTSARGSLIVVVDRSGMSDPAFAASGCDQRIADRSGDTRLTNPIETPDRSCDGPHNRSTMADPPLHPPIWKDSIAAADSTAALGSVPSGGSGGMAIDLADRWPDRADVALHLVELGCDDPALVDEILEAKPELTLEQLESQWAIALQREESGYTDNARALLFGTLRKPGGWLYGRATSSVMDWSAYAREQAAAAAAPPPAPPDDFEAALAHARQIAPDATLDELNIIAADLLDGRSEGDALEWLEGERARRAYLAERGRPHAYAA